jgi:hypothetical protein
MSNKDVRHAQYMPGKNRRPTGPTQMTSKDPKGPAKSTRVNRATFHRPDVVGRNKRNNTK